MYFISARFFHFQVNLTGAFASAARNDSETQIYVDLMDPKCIITRTSEIATLDLATVSPSELTEHGVKVNFFVIAYYLFNNSS